MSMYLLPGYGNDYPPAFYSIIEIATVPVDELFTTDFDMDGEDFEPGDTISIHYRITPAGILHDFNQPITLYYGILGLRIDEFSTTELKGNLTYKIPDGLTNGNHLFVVSVGDYERAGYLGSQASYSSIRVEKISSGTSTPQVWARSPFDYTVLFVLIISLVMGFIAFRRSKKGVVKDQWLAEEADEFPPEELEKLKMKPGKVEENTGDPDDEEDGDTAVEEEIVNDKEEKEVNGPFPRKRPKRRKPGKGERIVKKRISLKQPREPFFKRL